MSSHPRATEFHRIVLGHIRAAAEACPEATPKDVFDPVVRDMMDELQQVFDYMHSLGAAEREQQDREFDRDNRVKAKQLVPDIEALAMNLDERVQKAIQGIAGDADGRSIGSMLADLLINAFVRFTDALPEGAFAADRLVPDSFPSKTDATVAGIVALLQQRRGATP